MKTAGIIGGMDFLGCDITLKFLSEDFRVKVPVTHSVPFKSRLINTGLSVNVNLEICRTNLDDDFQLKQFVQDCDIIVHCGIPFKLGVTLKGTSLYVPLVKQTWTLLKGLIGCIKAFK